MKTIEIFAIVWLASVANSFWEAYVEGRKTMEEGKVGWKIRLWGNYYITGYHFFLFYVMWPLLLSLPLVISGWDKKLFGILVSAYFSGNILEDFMWFVVNPVVNFSEFRSDFTNHYPWIKIGRVKIIPLFYVIGILISVLSWYFVWR